MKSASGGNSLPARNSELDPMLAGLLAPQWHSGAHSGNTLVHFLVHAPHWHSANTMAWCHILIFLVLLLWFSSLLSFLLVALKVILWWIPLVILYKFQPSWCIFLVTDNQLGIWPVYHLQRSRGWMKYPTCMVLLEEKQASHLESMGGNCFKPNCCASQCKALQGKVRQCNERHNV